MEKVNRRNLSGIYIFHQFEGEEKGEPTCFEDCPPEKQYKWMSSLKEDAIKDLAIQLANSLRLVGDTFELKRD